MACNMYTQNKAFLQAGTAGVLKTAKWRDIEKH